MIFFDPYLHNYNIFTIDLKKVTAEKPAVEKKEPEAEVEETFCHLGKLIQIRKPNTRTNPVTSCILELFNGKHAGKLVSAVTSSIYMWG